MHGHGLDYNSRHQNISYADLKDVRTRLKVHGMKSPPYVWFFPATG